MKNKKGFTLIEIIISVFLIGIICLVCIVAIKKNNTNKKFEKFIDDIKLSANVFAETKLSNDRKKIIENGDSFYLQFSELIDNGLLDYNIYNPYSKLTIDDKRYDCFRLYKSDDNSIEIEYPTKLCDNKTEEEIKEDMSDYSISFWYADLSIIRDLEGKVDNNSSETVNPIYYPYNFVNIIPSYLPESLSFVVSDKSGNKIDEFGMLDNIEKNDFSFPRSFTTYGDGIAEFNVDGPTKLLVKYTKDDKSTSSTFDITYNLTNPTPILIRFDGFYSDKIYSYNGFRGCFEAFDGVNETLYNKLNDLYKNNNSKKILEYFTSKGVYYIDEEGLLKLNEAMDKGKLKYSNYKIEIGEKSYSLPGLYEKFAGFLELSTTIDGPLHCTTVTDENGNVTNRCYNEGGVRELNDDELNKAFGKIMNDASNKFKYVKSVITYSDSDIFRTYDTVDISKEIRCAVSNGRSFISVLRRNDSNPCSTHLHEHGIDDYVIKNCSVVY